MHSLWVSGRPRASLFGEDFQNTEVRNRMEIFSLARPATLDSVSLRVSSM